MMLFCGLLSSRSSHFSFSNIIYTANELACVYLLVVRLLFNSRKEGGTHTQDTNLANQCPCWVVEALTLRRCVFLMSSEIFQLRNPRKLYLILSFKLGIVGHLEELAICSRVGRTAWRKVRVCSLCLWGFT